MNCQEFWVSEGRIVSRATDEHGKPCSDRELLQQRDQVKIEVHDTSIVIHWVMSSANWASLFFAKEWISFFDGPFKLIFFNAGWFDETYDTARSAKNRIDNLILKGDVRLSTRVFTRDFLGSATPVASELVDLLKSGVPDQESAVECSVNTESGKVDVDHIGKKSLLARIWGDAHISYPCQTGHSYDKIVSKAYFDAIKYNRPVYDQVLASMVKPTGKIEWVGYHRVIFPSYNPTSKSIHVSVNCALAPVDIPLF